MNATEARSMIERAVAYDKAPSLTPAEVTDLLGLAIAESPWAPETAYRAGAYVIPTDPDGERFVATFDGISGTVEPVWADGVTDAGVVWDAGGDITFDVYGAVALGWEWKAAKAASGYDLSQGDSSWDRSQVYDHCMKQAAYYRARSAGIVDAAVAQSTGRSGLGTVTVAPPSTQVRYKPGRGPYIRIAE